MRAMRGTVCIDSKGVNYPFAAYTGCASMVQKLDGP